jgi:hypothetical protein
MNTPENPSTTPPRKGRPPLIEKAGKRTTLYLTEHDMELARRLGDGNASKGIRQALELAAKKTA